jgi:hypothetical protein
MRGHASLGGMSTDVAASTQVRASNLIPFPAGSIARRAPLKGADIRQASADIFKLAGAFLFVLLTGLSFVASLFMCFLCRF